MRFLKAVAIFALLNVASGKVLKCNENSHFEECGSACPVTCETLLSSSDINCLEECVPQCVCDEGFVKQNGNCVVKQACLSKEEMPVCGAHSRFEECGSACPVTCETLLSSSNVNCIEECIPQCVCDEGYVMYNGGCVMKQECAAKLEVPQCRANARFEECGSACPTTCDTLFSGSQVACTEQCVPSCVCNEGYVMQHGNCVVKHACLAETPVCGAHSKFEECGSACPATCESFLSSSHVSCIEECVPQCVCDEGYVMYNGGCVMQQECAAKLEVPKCGANARFEECGSACPTTCNTLFSVSQVACTEQCVPSCVCNEGYVIQNGNCVVKQACLVKETPVCGAHSKFEECGSACPTTCETLLSSSHVSCIEECVPQCVCDEGYVMYNGGCVMKQECAAKLEVPQCGANARFEECGSACPTTCDTLFSGSQVACTEQCVPSCVCNEGYVMQNGNCVVKQACLAKETPVCGAYSKFEECGSACPATCETLLSSSHISCIEECVPQCVCDEGYVMYNGDCVMKQECAAKLEVPQCGANARFEECGFACPTTCDTLFSGSQVGCTEQCVPSCVCNEGYVMQNGNCVVKQACLAKETPVCGAHSKFEECGSACPATCETLLSSSHVSCIEECVPQCICDEGYVMYNGGCVMKQECAAKLEVPQCGANARFEECGSASPTTCDTLFSGSHVACTEQCVPSCVCNEGYVMQNGNCVVKQACLAKETPVCGAHSKFEECGSACPATCETLLSSSHVSCIEECVPQCVCDEGYVMYNGGCVIKQECSSLL